MVPSIMVLSHYFTAGGEGWSGSCLPRAQAFRQRGSAWLVVRAAELQNCRNPSIRPKNIDFENADTPEMTSPDEISVSAARVLPRDPITRTHRAIISRSGFYSPTAKCRQIVIFLVRPSQIRTAHKAKPQRPTRQPNADTSKTRGTPRARQRLAT